MLKLLVRIPLRQRNVREMQLGDHLYQDQHGHWQLSFRGDDLKIGNRGAQVNTYHVDLTDYCPDFLPVLEEFLQVHRPKLPNATTSPFVFLTWRGTPFSEATLRLELSSIVAMRTGQRFYPAPHSDHLGHRVSRKDPRFHGGGDDVGRYGRDGDEDLLRYRPQGPTC